MMNSHSSSTLPTTRVTADDVRQWSQATAFRFKIAEFIARHTLRGKGWFPRFIGRKFFRGMKTTIRTASGSLLAVDPENLDIYTSIVLNGGVWDQRVLNACLRVTRLGDIFYDVGANAGYMSIEVANRFKSAVQVIAFEPQSRLAHQIAISSTLNNLFNIKIYMIMLGDETGAGELFIPAHAIHASSISRDPKAKRVACPQFSLDQLVLEGKVPPPNVIKIDVEGGEMNIFRGARQTIRRHAPTIIFEADSNMQRFGYNRRDILDELVTSANYSFYGLSNDGLSYIEATPINVNDMSCSDFIAVPPERRLTIP